MNPTVAVLDERTKTHAKAIDAHGRRLDDHEQKIAGLRADARVGALIGGAIAGLFCTVAGGVAIYVITLVLPHHTG